MSVEQKDALLCPDKTRGVVYKITVDGRFYIGATKETARHRFQTHFRHSRTSERFLALNHGRCHTPLEKALALVEANEVHLEVLYHSTNPGALYAEEARLILELGATDPSIGLNVNRGLQGLRTKREAKRPRGTYWSDEKSRRAATVNSLEHRIFIAVPAVKTAGDGHRRRVRRLYRDGMTVRDLVEHSAAASIPDGEALRTLRNDVSEKWVRIQS